MTKPPAKIDLLFPALSALMLAAHLIFGEPLPPLMAIGTMVTLAGVVLAASAARGSPARGDVV